MAERVLPVNAYTTLDLVDAEREGHGWTQETLGVVNVTTDADGAVVLALELDDGASDGDTIAEAPCHGDHSPYSTTDGGPPDADRAPSHPDAIPHHADRIRLSPDDARTLARALEDGADRVDAD